MMSLVEIRKLRKKIRQIECLEQLDRKLTEDETLKVSQINHAYLGVGVSCCLTAHQHKIGYVFSAIIS